MSIFEKVQGELAALWKSYGEAKAVASRTPAGPERQRIEDRIDDITARFGVLQDLLGFYPPKGDECSQATDASKTFIECLVDELMGAWRRHSRLDEALLQLRNPSDGRNRIEREKQHTGSHIEALERAIAAVKPASGADAVIAAAMLRYELDENGARARLGSVKLLARGLLEYLEDQADVAGADLLGGYYLPADGRKLTLRRAEDEARTAAAN